MRQPVIVVGGGGHARVVIEAAHSAGYNILGFVDPAPCDETVLRLGVTRLGADSEISRYPDAQLLLGIGTIGTDQRRRAIVERLGAERWARVVHSTAWISPSAFLERGVVVLAGAIVNACARLGPFAVINSAAVVEHDATVGAFAQLAPRAVLGGGATIGDGAFVGMGAVVRNNIIIGARCFVAMGGVVVGDIGEGLAVRGVPATIIPSADGAQWR